MRIEIPLFVLVLMPLFCAASIFVRWRVNFYWTPTFMVPSLLWISFVYLCTMYGWLDMDDPAVRVIWIRPGLLIFFLAFAANNLIVARQGAGIRRMISRQGNAQHYSEQ